MISAVKHSCYLKYNLQLFAEGSGGEKTEEPTSKKLADARKKGQTMKSMDVTTAATLLVFFLLLRVLIGYMGERFYNSFNMVYSHLSDYANMEFTVNQACTILQEVIRFVLLTALPFMLVVYVVIVVTLLLQVKWKVTLEPLRPKFDKFNPVSGMKRLFSKDKLVELLKSIAKIGVLVYVVYSYLKDEWALVLNMYAYSLPQAISLIGNTILNIGLRISFCFAVIGVIDFFYQKWKFHEDMKMTKQEVKDEFKQAEGDPKVKSQQRARMQQAAQRRMMQELPKADVVITNPTHLAVAILYDKERYEAPIVVAKGADFLAEKIKERAREYEVEIVENKPLARMLYHNVDIGAQIPPELYQAVAELLAYVYGLKGKI